MPAADYRPRAPPGCHESVTWIPSPTFFFTFFTRLTSAPPPFSAQSFLAHPLQKLQSILIQEAASRLFASQARAADDFEDFTQTAWKSVPDALGAESLGSYLVRVDEVLRDVRRTLRTSRASVSLLAAEAAKSTDDRSAAGTALCIPDTKTGVVREIRWEISVPPLVATRPIDPHLYTLKTKSRYGLLRRALVFFAGIADVVYSSQHIALMSQHTHAPRGVLVRRFSLVALLVVLIAADLLFEIRKKISHQIELQFGAPDLSSLGDTGTFLSTHFGTIAGVLVWTIALSLVYFAAALIIRARSRVWQKRLLSLQKNEKSALQSIHREHELGLFRWLREYAESLDQAVDLGAKHAELLVDYHRGRLRRRIAETSPVHAAREISAALLAQLPEASGDLEDRVTTQKRSFLHYLWPREEDMRVEVELAQMRAAWRDLEQILTRISGSRPDPEAIDALFRRLCNYTAAFRDLLPESALADLRDDYQTTVTSLVAETQADLDDLDLRLSEIAARLNEQLAVAGSLVKFQVEMTNHKIETQAAKLAAEVLATRERARLEAMAFEI
ncbi:MAG: hypothetical protein IPK82_22625 [Polyangiaceae bacterium]|nr:hypothetical protein [Polyangiaceae bacterium]